MFHRVRFPLARGITQVAIAERIETTAELHRENERFWNWLGPKPGASPGRSPGQLAWGVTMQDGTPVLGNVELKSRALILSVTSAERAQRGTALLGPVLGPLVAAPLTEIETVEQVMAARRERPDEPAPAVDPKVATPLVHAMLDRQYRATVGMLSAPPLVRPPEPPPGEIASQFGSST